MTGFLGTAGEARITGFETYDLRFPTSDDGDGSDAMHPDPDYSAAYVVLKTDAPGLLGHGFTFTIGRGNDVVVAAVEALARKTTGRRLADFAADSAAWWRDLASDTQLRWLGPEKGVVHLATAAVINALWDLWARAAKRPLWRLATDLTPEDFVRCVEFRYLSDALTPEEALEIVRRNESGKAARIAELERRGFPAYTTSAGWLGYSDEKIARLCREGVAKGFRHFKMKVGADPADDRRRAATVREAIGPERKLMFDANQRWDVGTAIAAMRDLREFDPWWIEEPTSPDDVLGHAAIAKAVAPIGVATGEQCQNRVVFKQLLQAQALRFCQLDACRLGGVNETFAVMLLAKKFGVPVCPHAGGVGLCELVSHLIMIDYARVGASFEDRVAEYVDHLHEHFVDPCAVRDGRYLAPTAHGYSAEIKAPSREAYRYPDGAVWRARIAARRGGASA
jgi:L-fuconate dehydratase